MTWYNFVIGPTVVNRHMPMLCIRSYSTKHTFANDVLQGANERERARVCVCVCVYVCFY